MAIDSLPSLVRAIRDSQLLEPKQVKKLAGLESRCRNTRDLTRELIQSGWMTSYQVRQIVQGQGGNLVLGPYHVLDLIGEGGWGQVFKARHRKLDRVVALKVIRQDLASDPEVVGRFYREMKIASQLSHANVVRVYDSGPIGSTHFLAMEYLQGSDLDRQVGKAGPLSPDLACDYMRQAAEGLAHAHQCGLVHRDIKPANLFLSQGTVKILDLGLARLLQGGQGEGGANAPTLLTTDGPVMFGTVDYLAPEQALDFHRADIRSDIYSLGCTFCFLLTGKPPFGHGPLAVKLMRHQHADPPDLGNMPAGVNKILQRMLAKRPKDRFQTPAEVVAALRNLHGGKSKAGPGWLTSIQSHTHVLGKRIWQWGKQRPRRVAGLLCLFLFLGLLYWLLPGLLDPTGSRSELERLRDRAHQGADLPALRRDLIAYRLKHAGSAEAFAAAKLLMQLPSPWDGADPSGIPANLRLPGDPGELVAVLGKPGQARVRSLAFSPGGMMLAAGSNDGLIRLWSATAEVRAPLKGHERGVAALAFSPETNILASGGDQVRLWDVRSGKELWSSPVPNSVMCLGFSPDGKALAAGMVGGMVIVLNASSGKPQASFKGMGHLVFSLAIGSAGKTLAVASYQHPVRLWNLADGKEQDPIAVKSVFCLTTMPQGGSLAMACSDKTVIWDVDAGRERMNLPAGGGRELAVSPDGLRYALTTPRGVVKVSHFDAADKPRSWRLPFTVPIQYDASYVPAFAPDGRHLAVAGDNGVVYLLRLNE